MKRIISVIMAAFLLASLTACSSSSRTVEMMTQEETTDAQAAAESQEENIENTSNVLPETAQDGTAQDTEAEPESETPVPTAHSDVLIVYFSATGTTKSVAERIANVTGGDLYEILAAQPYSDEDLDYHDANSRTTHEQNDPDIRPEIGSEDVSFEGYKTIYLGYPIWHGQAPKIMNTFVEKYNFGDITVIPFCTSGSSGIGQSGVTLEGQAGSGRWLSGERFGGNVTEDELDSWVSEMK